MAPRTWVLCFLIICSLVCSSRAQEIIQAVIGQNVILPCKAPNNYNINNTAVEWIRPGLDPDHVLVYRDGRFDPYNQHPSYQNRVDLQDKEMKDGNISLILKNVMMEDTGTYVCRVFEKGKKYPISNNSLELHLSGEKSEGANGGIIRDEENKIGGDQIGISRGHLGVVAVMLPFLAVLASLCFLVYKRSMRQNPNLPVPPDEEV